MFRKNIGLNPLEAHKQLLIAESELNRVQIIQAWQIMANDVQLLVNKARKLSSMASVMAPLAFCVLSWQRKKSAPSTRKSSWWQSLLKGAGLVGTLWTKCRWEKGSQETK